MTDAETATGLDHAANSLKTYAMALRGEHIDQTGVGLWNIFCTQLQMAMNVRVITEEQWNHLLECEKTHARILEAVRDSQQLFRDRMENKA